MKITHNIIVIYLKKCNIPSQDNKGGEFLLAHRNYFVFYVIKLNYRNTKFSGKKSTPQIFGL